MERNITTSYVVSRAASAVVRTADFHPSDAYLAAGDVAGTVRVWDGR